MTHDSIPSREARLSGPGIAEELACTGPKLSSKGVGLLVTSIRGVGDDTWVSLCFFAAGAKVDVASRFVLADAASFTSNSAEESQEKSDEV